MVGRFACTLALAAAVFLILPLLFVLPIGFTSASTLQFPPPGYSLRLVRELLSDPSWGFALRNSLIVGAGAAMLATTLALGAGLWLYRGRVGARGALESALFLPMFVPTIVSAVAYFYVFGRLGLQGTRIGLILAHASLALPIALLALKPAILRLDPALDRAAASCGASRLQALRYVTLPALRPGLLVAGLFAFLHSFDDTVVAVFVAGRDAATLPKKMFESIRLETDPIIATVSSLLFGLILAACLLHAALNTRRR
jgi:putative spermidine/putrescine transport system permease protein